MFDRVRKLTWAISLNLSDTGYLTVREAGVLAHASCLLRWSYFGEFGPCPFGLRSLGR